MESSLKDRARKLAALIGKMSEGERLALAARLPSVVNPSGHVLTFNNTALLFQQSGREDLTMVAGFRQWLDAGRCVRKGEHAIGCIMVPLGGKRREGEPAPEGDGDGDQGDGGKAPRVFFRFVPVFDVSQTDALEVAHA
jgi:hypothetical protein